MPFEVYTDASKDSVGAVLAQVRDGLEHVVVHASQALSPTQECWSTSDREFWAGVWAVRKFKRPLLAVCLETLNDGVSSVRLVRLYGFLSLNNGLQWEGLWPVTLFRKWRRTS